MESGEAELSLPSIHILAPRFYRYSVLCLSSSCYFVYIQGLLSPHESRMPTSIMIFLFLCQVLIFGHRIEDYWIPFVQAIAKYFIVFILCVGETIGKENREEEWNDGDMGKKIPPKRFLIFLTISSLSDVVIWFLFVQYINS